MLLILLLNSNGKRKVRVGPTLPSLGGMAHRRSCKGAGAIRKSNNDCCLMLCHIRENADQIGVASGKCAPYGRKSKITKLVVEDNNK